MSVFRGRWRRAGMRLLNMLLGFALCVSVALPWFSMPMLGLSVPVPAWNVLGLGLLVLGGLHLLRALELPATPWAIRLLWPWVAYRWWWSEQMFRDWAKSTLVPVQLKFSGLNAALERLGFEPISFYDPVLWRELTLGWGYQVAGGSLLLALLLTLFDGGAAGLRASAPGGGTPATSRCPDCEVPVEPQDACCHGCGQSFQGRIGCSGCGRIPLPGDRYCRSCGVATSLEPSVVAPSAPPAG
jgi:hypothetical protein